MLNSEKNGWKKPVFWSNIPTLVQLQIEKGHCFQSKIISQEFAGLVKPGDHGFLIAPEAKLVSASSVQSKKNIKMMQRVRSKKHASKCEINYFVT